MPIRIGNDLIDNPQIGGNNIDKVYVGSGIVYCRNVNQMPAPAISSTGNNVLSNTTVQLTCNANDPDHTSGFTFIWYTDPNDIPGTTVRTGTPSGALDQLNVSVATSTRNGVTNTYYCLVRDADGAEGTASIDITWLPAYSATLTYNGGTISGSTSSTPASSFTITGTGGVSPVGASISGLNHGLGNAGNNASESSFRSNIGSAQGGDTTLGACDMSLSPAASDVATGTTFNQSGEQTFSTTRRFRLDTYSYTSSGPTTGSTRTVTFTLSGSVPSGFFGASGFNNNFDTASASQLGRPGSDGRTGSASSPCGTVSSGNTCQLDVTLANASSGTQPCTNNNVAGTGVYNFTISGETAPTNGDTDTYSISIGQADGSPDTNYNWTVTGGTIDSGQGTTSISVTWTTDGAQTVSASNSYAGAAGSTFSGSDTLNVTVASAAVTGTLTLTNARAFSFLGNDGCTWDVSITDGHGDFFTNNLGSQLSIGDNPLGSALTFTQATLAQNSAAGTYRYYPTDSAGNIIGGMGAAVAWPGASYTAGSHPTVTPFTIS